MGNCILSKAVEFLSWMRASVGLGVWFSGKWGKRSHCKAADGQKENKSRSGRLMRSSDFVLSTRGTLDD